MRDVVRFGVVGVGVMGRIHADNLAHRVPGAKLVAVADLDPQTAQSVAAAAGIDAAFTSEANLLALAEVDAIVLATPPETHAAIIEAAAAAGKHIFCEKPLERTLAAADRALAAAESAAVRICVGFNRRYDPHFLNLRDEARSGRIGRPLTAYFVARDPIEVLAERPRPPGDLYLSTTIHELDFAPFLFGGEIETIYSAGAVTHGDPVIDDPDTATTTLRFASGQVVVIENSRVAAHGYEQFFEVFGDAGVLSAPPDPADRAVRYAPGEPVFLRRYRESYIAELADFARSIREGLPSPVPPNEARLAQILAYAAHESYLSGRAVSVRDIA